MAETAFPQTGLEFGVFDWIESSSAAPAEIFEHKLQIAEIADAAGFRGWHLAEHQGTPLSIDGAPSLMIAAAAQRTRRLRLGALTWCLPWYNPYRFYSEICMLDHMSGGRLDLGVGRGVSAIESEFMGIRGGVEESRARYRETLDILFAACGAAVLDFEGRYHSYKGLELQLKPLQQPYPPLWFPSSDPSSIEFTARHGYHTVALGPPRASKGLFERYREAWVRHRGEPGRHNAHVAAPKLGRVQHVLVAETDAEAMAAGLPAFRAWADHIHYLTRQRGLPDLMRNMDPASPDAVQRLVAGAPTTVAEQLAEIVRDSGTNYLLLVFSFGDLAHERAMRSMQLFVREVMPALRPA